MAKAGKKLPEELEEFLKDVQENLSLYPETIVFNHIKDYITDLSTKQVAWLTSTIVVSTEFRLRIFKKRCDAGDKLACEMLDLSINGDPYSKNETVRKGLVGLWETDNDIESGKLLVELGKITQQELDKKIRAGKDQETINGKTREQLLCELAAEAKTYPTADAFSMAMIMRQLKSVPQPTTANVYNIIEGKYKSADEFWAVVQKGEICAGVGKREEIPAPPEKETPPPPPKEKEKPKPEPVRVAPEEPVISVPEKDIEAFTTAATLVVALTPGLDLMKKEIEERIARMKVEKARGELKAGEGNGTREDTSFLFKGVQDYVDIKEYKFYDSTKAKDLFFKNCPICTGPHFPRRKEIFADPEFIKKLDIKMLSFLVAHEQEHIENKEALADEFAASLGAINRLKIPKDEAEKLAVRWYRTYWIKSPIISIDKFIEPFSNILNKWLSDEEKQKLGFSKVSEGVREDLPKEAISPYAAWTFEDFETIINRNTNLEDLLELQKHLSESKAMTPRENIQVFKLLTNRISYISKGGPELRRQIEEQQRELMLAKKDDRPLLKEEYTKKAATAFITCQDYQAYEVKCLGCKFKTTAIRCVYGTAMREGSGVREGVDILTEPKDYSQWTFGDFEGLLPGIDSVEELEEMYEQVGASGVISDSDKETLRNMIRARIDEVKRFYTEWAAKGVK